MLSLILIQVMEFLSAFCFSKKPNRCRQNLGEHPLFVGPAIRCQRGSRRPGPDKNGPCSLPGPPFWKHHRVPHPTAKDERHFGRGALPLGPGRPPPAPPGAFTPGGQRLGSASPSPLWVLSCPGSSTLQAASPPSAIRFPPPLLTNPGD